jgi:hypothetical protein
MIKYTVKNFEREFPTDDICLEWIFNHRYPNGVSCPVCQKVTKHHRVAKRSCFECDNFYFPQNLVSRYLLDGFYSLWYFCQTT